MYKLLHKNLEHRGFKYKEGLNVDHLPFTAYGDCEPGGLYYTDFAHIGVWLSAQHAWIADVTVPVDARVHPGPHGDKWKADQIVLSNIRPLGTFLAQQAPSLALKVVSDSACWLSHVDNTPELIAWIRQEHPEWVKYLPSQ